MNDPLNVITGFAVVACAGLVIWLTAQMATTDEKDLILATLGLSLIVGVLAVLAGFGMRRPRQRG